STDAAAEEEEDPVLGAWTYRSYINDPDPNTPFNDLQFAAADLTFEKPGFGQLKGRLRFGQDFLKLNGTIAYGNPFTVRFQGASATPRTIEQGQPWVYDYLGYLAPAWPNGTDQRPAILALLCVRYHTPKAGQKPASLPPGSRCARIKARRLRTIPSACSHIW